MHHKHKFSHATKYTFVCLLGLHLLLGSICLFLCGQRLLLNMSPLIPCLITLQFTSMTHFLVTMASDCYVMIGGHVILTFPLKYNLTLFVLHKKLIGTPDDSSLGFLRSDNARRYVRQLPQYPKQNFSLRFPNMSPGAVDLLEKMLVFDPNKRITGMMRFS